MRVLMLCVVLVSLVSGYSPSRGTNNQGCGGGGCGGQVVQQQNLVKSQSCGGGGCGGCASQGCVQPPKSVSGQYWWQGNNSPFTQSGCGGGVSCGGAAANPCGGGGCGVQQQFPQNNPRPQQQFVQNNPRPQQQFQQNNPQQQQQIAPQSNAVLPPMGICPASFVCVHWQLCRNGFLITDGSGQINKQIKNIPQQVQSTSQSCGGNMICCGVPSYNPPNPSANQPSIPFQLPNPQPQPRPNPPTPSANRPSIPFQLPNPQPQPRPNPPTPSANRPSIPFQRPNPQPQPQPQAPPPQVIRPRPTPRPTQRPAPAPARRPAPAPRPQQGYNNQPPPQPFRPRPQPTNNPPVPFVPRPQSTNNNPVRPVANPPGLSGPPSPPMMNNNMMMMMMGPMRNPGTCSAGLYCVERPECNPYNGFIINNPNQLMAVFPGADTVPVTECVVNDGSIQDGVCCQQVHPNPQGFD